MKGEAMFKIGDTVHRIHKDEIVTCKIKNAVDYGTHWVYSTTNGDVFLTKNINKTYFGDYADAEREVNRRTLIAKKRVLLKAQEAELNTKLGLTDHCFIK